MLVSPDGSNANQKMFRHISHDLFGPIIQRWLLGLHQYISYYDDGDTAFLHCARAGFRIQKLYQAFVEGRDLPTPASSVFCVSRVSACKGTFARSPRRAAELISREYWNRPISEVIQGIFRHNPEMLEGIDLSGDEFRAHGSVFSEWVEGHSSAAEKMRAYFNQCSADFDAYVHKEVAGKSRAVLIDSGWQGSMQSLLTHAFPKIRWRGLYFGRSLLPAHDKTIVDEILGIMFEAESYKPSVPPTAFVRHRHLIEALLEPNGPSIEEVPGGTFESAARKMILANQNEDLGGDDDAMYPIVLEYLNGEGKSASITSIVARYQSAMTELARIIITPTRAEASVLSIKARSADFGKSLKVPVLVARKAGDGADARIRDSLWQEGQVALEFEGGFARDMQLRLAGCSDAAEYFESHKPDPNILVSEQSVAIITRTKNRPLLLKRAASSVANQAYGNYTWVVVNDGGDEAAVREVIENCAVDRRKILLVNNSRSLGMEAASNAGIKNSKSDLVVIHDDDDSWESTFLEKTVSFLTAGKGQRYGGVITQTTYISEEIRGDVIVEHRRLPYMDWVRNVQLVEMAAGNIFAPIAFVYRRKILEEIGGYNESLPVLGDWFFNLEFLLRADIGVLTEPLANYHHRDRGDSSAYSNSVIGGVSKHEEYASIARNEFIRRNAGSAHGAVAAVVGYFASDIRRDRIVERHSESAPIKDYGPADKYWAIIHLNQNIKRKLTGLFKGAPRYIDPNIEWSELENIARLNNIDIPIPPDFDEYAYLRRYHDVAHAVKLRQLFSGYHHYILYGRGEGRIRPAP